MPRRSALILAAAFAALSACQSEAADIVWRSLKTGTNLTDPLAASTTPSTGTGTSAPYTPLIISGPPQLSVSLGKTTNIKAFTVVNATGKVSWSVGGSLPAGLALDPSTGKIIGVAVAAGTYRVMIAVKDGSGRVAEYNLTINVS